MRPPLWENRAESANPEDQPIKVDLEQDGYEMAGVAVGALIGDGFNRPAHGLKCA